MAQGISRRLFDYVDTWHEHGRSMAWGAQQSDAIQLSSQIQAYSILSQAGLVTVYRIGLLVVGSVHSAGFGEIEQ
jgi:hypothetical protein